MIRIPNVIKNSLRKPFRNRNPQKQVRLLPHIWSVLLEARKVKPWQDLNLPDQKLSRATSNVRQLKTNEQYEFFPYEDVFINVIGHATCLIRIADITILTDPVWAERIGPFGIFGPKRKLKTMDRESCPPVDLILVSHDHYDHLDKDSIKFFVNRDNPEIRCGKGVGKLIRNAHPQARVQEMNWWETSNIQDTRITFLPAQHFSGRGLLFNATLWGAFMIEKEGKKIFFAADTGLDQNLFYEIKRQFGKIDVGLIPIGAYDPQKYLKDFHLSPGDAIELHKILEIETSIAIHFGTYQLSLDNAKQQKELFYREREIASRMREINFFLPSFNTRYHIKDLEAARPKKTVLAKAYN